MKLHEALLEQSNSKIEIERLTARNRKLSLLISELLSRITDGVKDLGIMDSEQNNINVTTSITNGNSVVTVTGDIDSVQQLFQIKYDCISKDSYVTGIDGDMMLSVEQISSITACIAEFV